MTDEEADKPEGRDDEMLLSQALDDFKRCEDYWKDNRDWFVKDIKFARLDEQWDATVKADREKAGLPCLTINKLQPFIRQVVNDGRQNKPAIKVLPQDSEADPETAEIYSGLIRNIETSSDADVAFDTALDNSASGGLGYFRINLAYAHDGSFDQDIIFERIPDPLTVWGDPDSEAADSSDWYICFVTRLYSKAQFKRAFPKAEAVDFTAQEYPSGWVDGERVQIAEYWVREQTTKEIVLLSSGQIVDLEVFEKDAEQYAAQGIQVVGEPREVPDFKVTQHIVSGVAVLSSTKWAGKFIPIIPVYGEEVVCEGQRHFRSVHRSARDSQVMANAWETSATTTIALAPRAPWIGEEGVFTDPNWQFANSASLPYLEYRKGGAAPQRLPFNGMPAGDLQMTLRSTDNIKSTIGVYDAALGARSNETSGVAINARKLESDTSTFHFIDNLSRAIRHAGRILIDLIPKVYSAGRVIRILGEDGQPKTVNLGSPEEVQAAQLEAQQARQEQAADIARIYDLGAGRYDLTVSVGPGYSTKRQEAAAQMIEAARAFPGLMEVAGDIIAKNLDWPGAQEIAERLAQRMQQSQAPQGQPQAPVEQADPSKIIAAHTKQFEAQTDARQGDEKLAIDGYNAETQRMRAAHQIQQPTRLPRMPGMTG